ncbi:MAG TPA: ATP-dependent DNA helicase RecG [Candidatus Hydrogenedentes bacterium]|nr:ATP-dependent DNA helicase RecG [Candidatus Hydrogenedentota bacterium]
MTSPNLLDETVALLPGIGPKRAELLANLGVATVRDLVLWLPRTYEDRRRITPIRDAKEGDAITIEAEVVNGRAIRLRSRLSLADLTLADASGTIHATWFGRDFLVRALPKGARALFAGVVGKYKGLALKNPEYEILSGDDEDLLNTGRIVPIYRLTEGISHRMLRRWIMAALDAATDALEERLPEALRTQHGFPCAHDAIRSVHFPAELDAAHCARDRFAYEELLAIQLGVLRARAARLHEEKGYRHAIDGARLGALRESLPFALTGAQARAVDDILRDMASPRPMLRLLQGDVGCGKTAVALHAIAAAADGGFQTALMAPTEILAEQHAITLRDMLAPLGLEPTLLTGSTRGAKETRARIASGDARVVVGTHALVQESVAFHRLGLVVVDEQHRFGVVQRQRLAEKGLHPDVLHMTATPIPRTLAITVYGGMDLTIIDELPPGRTPVKTRRITPAKVDDLYGWAVKQAATGAQTYVVCPLVDESNARAVKAVTTHFEELSSGPFAALRCALLHGRMAGRDKDAVMHAFKKGALDVLFSTSVIEVGIDVPAATIMIIEDAAQFGLTQLHQLRGRVGRGAQESHCFLLGKPKTDEGKQRLDIFCSTTNGFEIAEADLTMRGPGEFYGIKQAGLSDLRAADLLRDVRLLDKARHDAQTILARDPLLADPAHVPLAEASRRFEQMLA